jgi:hypothetical protein
VRKLYSKNGLPPLPTRIRRESTWPLLSSLMLMAIATHTGKNKKINTDALNMSNARTVACE